MEEPKRSLTRQNAFYFGETAASSIMFPWDTLLSFIFPLWCTSEGSSPVGHPWTGKVNFKAPMGEAE